MLERLELKNQPNEDLVLEFFVKTIPEKADSILLSFIRHEMQKRLEEQRNKGFSGWHTPQIENENLLKRLNKNLAQGDYIDVINLASMLLAREALFTEKHYTKA